MRPQGLQGRWWTKPTKWLSLPAFTCRSGWMSLRNPKIQMVTASQGTTCREFKSRDATRGMSCVLYSYVKYLIEKLQYWEISMQHMQQTNQILEDREGARIFPIRTTAAGTRSNPRRCTGYIWIPRSSQHHMNQVGRAWTYHYTAASVSCTRNKVLHLTFTSSTISIHFIHLIIHVRKLERTGQNSHYMSLPWVRKIRKVSMQGNARHLCSLCSGHCYCLAMFSLRVWWSDAGTSSAGGCVQIQVCFCKTDASAKARGLRPIIYRYDSVWSYVNLCNIET